MSIGHGSIWTGNHTGSHRGGLPAFAVLAAVIFLVLAAGFSKPSRAGEKASVTVDATIRPHLVYLGDTATLEVIVSGTAEGEASAEIPPVNGLSFSGPSLQRNTRTSIVNGAITHLRTVTMTYKVTPLRTGEFKIPSITVTLEGDTYRTKPVGLRVSEPPSDDAIKLGTSVSTAECWAGEPVDVSYMWYLAEDIEGYTYTIPLLDKQDELSLDVKNTRPSVLGGELIRGAASPHGEQSRIEISGYEVPAQKFAVTIDGVDYIVYAVTFRIYPPAPGMQDFGSAAVKARVKHGTKVVIDEFWGRRRRVPDYKNLYAYGDPVTVYVKALPAENAPSGLSGAVGVFSIDVSTDESVVKVGDPLRLRITVSGDGLLSRVERPLLSEQPAFAGFQVTESLEPGQMNKEEGSVVFEQVVRPASGDIEQVPAVEFSFFDADRNVYRTVSSEPVPLKVLPTKVVTADDVLGRRIELPGVEAKKVEAREGVVRSAYNQADIFDNQVVPLGGLLAVAGAPPIAYGALALVFRRRRRLRGDRRYARQKRAAKRAEANLKTAREAAAAKDDGKFFDAVAAALGGYVSDMLDLGRGELTVSDVKDLLDRGALSVDAAKKAAAVLERCDTGRFGGVSLHGEELRSLIAAARDAMTAVRKGAF